jgi:hypothetical protein
LELGFKGLEQKGKYFKVLSNRRRYTITNLIFSPLTMPDEMVNPTIIFNNQAIGTDTLPFIDKNTVMIHLKLLSDRFNLTTELDIKSGLVITSFN